MYTTVLKEENREKLTAHGSLSLPKLVVEDFHGMCNCIDICKAILELGLIIYVFYMHN